MYIKEALVVEVDVGDLCVDEVPSRDVDGKVFSSRNIACNGAGFTRL